MKYSEVKGKPVVDVTTADALGSVHDLYIDERQQQVVALRVHVSGFFSGDRVLLWPDIQAMGENAVTVANVDVLREAKKVPEVQDLNRAGDIIGTKIITENGTDVGTDADIEIDPKTGAITFYVLHGNLFQSLQHREQLVPAAWVKTIGKGLIVVRDQAATENVQP